MGQWTVWTFWKKKNLLLLLEINHNFSIVEPLTYLYVTMAPPYALKHSTQAGKGKHVHTMGGVPLFL
jgi:hypothetical protein